MARKEVKGPITDNALNNINHNFIELYNEFVSAGMNAQEALNKVNQMVGIADNALKVAKQSDSKSDDTQQQLDDIILKDGNDIAEVVQARGGEPLLKDRLNKTDAQLAETVKKDEVNIYADEKAEKIDFNEFRDVTELAIIGLDAKIDNRPPPEPEIIHNLWDKDEVVDGLLSTTSGNLNPSTNNKTSDFLDVLSGTNYTFSHPEKIGEDVNYRWVFYNKDKSYISGVQTAFSPGKGWNNTIKTPSNANFIRISVNGNDIDDFTFNIGDKPMGEDDEGAIWDGGFWDGIPTPPLRDNSVHSKHLASRQVTEDKVADKAISTEKLSQELLNLIRSGSNSTNKPLTPYPRKLNFTVIREDWEEVNHLTQDGEVVYFKRGKAIYQSLDDGDTLVRVGTPSPDGLTVQAIRDLPDGQLIVSTTRDTDADIRSKVYKSTNYDRFNPEDTEFIEVLSAISSEANIYEPWGLEVHDNICLASEYGLRGDTGARHVFLSQDYGDTWEMIFDQKTTTVDIDGAPTWTTSAHLHTVHYDRYFERIWLVVGDAPNSATYYSDDFGDTWKFVDNPIDMQYTGIVSYPEGVVFGSDRGQNGLYLWKRTENKSDKVVIEPLKIINDDSTITHVFQRAFRRYAKKDELTLFPATRASSSTFNQGSVIMAFTGIDNPHLMYELEDTTRSGFINCVGVTAKGNILTSYNNGTNHSIMRAKAPLWE